MSIRTLFEKNLQVSPERVMFQFRCDGTVCHRTYREVGTRVAQIAQIPFAHGIAPRMHPIAIILENSPAWLEIYLAHASTAIPVVPIDPRLRTNEIQYMLNDAAVSAIYTDVKHIPVLEEILPELPEVKLIVLVDGKAHDAPASLVGRQCVDLEERMRELMEEAKSEHSALAQICVRDEDIASIIYTSGTTGLPKGAMLSHENFCADCEGSVKHFPSLTSQDDFFIVLPLFHAFSFTANFLAAIAAGAGMQFASSLRTIPEDMRTFRPSIMMAVPLMVEKLHQKITDGINSNKKARFLRAIGLNCIVINRVRKTFGGRLRLLIVGGAPCSAKLIVAMRKFKMPIIEGYGLTEAGPIVSISKLETFKPGTIGLPLCNVEVRLADKNELGVGELQVRGPNIMQGYLNNPEATAEVFDGDWLRTGDLASQDKDGFLIICGRKKALIVNREGKNIYPEEVELCIGRDSRVLDVVVVGYADAATDVGEKVGAIVVPNLDAYKSADGSVPTWEDIEADMRKIVQKQCALLAEYKHPRKLKICREPLERTSTQKIKRYKYRDALN